MEDTVGIGCLPYRKEQPISEYWQEGWQPYATKLRHPNKRHRGCRLPTLQKRTNHFRIRQEGWQPYAKTKGTHLTVP